MFIPVADLIVKFLERLETEYIFGIPGAHILPVYDALIDSGIKPILAKHEQGASFMACGYARQSRKVGVCIATAGPGATNLVTGLANAFMDRLPVLAITGETPTYSFGKGALQESSGEGFSINQADIFKGATRFNTIVMRTDALLEHLTKCTDILLSANPGPVLLSFPFNILKETVDESILDRINFSSRTPFPEDSVPAARILELLKNAASPVIIAGAGSVLSGAEEAITEFSARTNVPVTTTLKARGVLPESSQRSLGVLGITSQPSAYKYIVEQADLLIVSGASFGERTSYNWSPELLKDKKIIQIDNDGQQLGKVFTPDIAIKSDIRRVFETLNPMLNTAHAKSGEKIAEYRERYSNHDIRDDEFLLVSKFLKSLKGRYRGELSVFDDNIIYMQRFCAITKSGTYFPNSGLSSLGHAVPAAIGAKLATSRPVVALLGDGGFQMCCMELMTAVNYSIPVTVVLLNNSSLGLVRKNQFYNYGGRFIASDFVNPDYAKLSESFGVGHFRIVSPADIEPVLESADIRGGTSVIELVLNKNEFPRYSSGR